MSPLIGISCRSGRNPATGKAVYCMNQTYIHAVESAGGMPILIPLLSDMRRLDTLLSRLDGLLLPGGVDIQPHLYGEEVHPLLDEVDPPLDELEFTLAHWALDKDIPTLGICRGFQLLNVALGGTLYQDVLTERPGSLRHMYLDLPRTQLTQHLTIEAGSRMGAILGTRELGVNSLHHQAIKKPGKGVQVTGRAEDGVAELLEAEGYRFVLAVQGHPEELYTQEPAWANLFRTFVEACTPNWEEEDQIERTVTLGLASI